MYIQKYTKYLTDNNKGIGSSILRLFAHMPMNYWQ